MRGSANTFSSTCCSPSPRCLPLGHAVLNRQVHGRRTLVVVSFQRAAKRMKYSGAGQTILKEPLVITVEPDGSDSWRLEPVVDLLRQGGVGIIPTDTLPAIVCDLENKDAAVKLYAIKELNPKKPLSIICRNFTDISHYTSGFPQGGDGQPNWFNVMKRTLPGPYTIILPASKNLPSQFVDFLKGKTMHRKSVGVRLPADPVCQAVVEGLGRPVLCTSVHVPKRIDNETEAPDVGPMLEAYGARGLDFVVDVGARIVMSSSVVDMTGAEPEVLRHGQGDTSMFE